MTVHLTIVCLVTWLFKGSEAGVDLVLQRTIMRKIANVPKEDISLPTRHRLFANISRFFFCYTRTWFATSPIFLLGALRQDLQHTFRNFVSIFSFTIFLN